LWDVSYEDLTFSVDSEAASSARVAFDERHREARHAAAATGAIRDRIAASDRGRTGR
ncbi:tRNA pseudouridine(38-40) synthase TruA, partial [Halorubrum sp. SD626R]